MKKNILISGSSGLVGSAIKNSLFDYGHSVSALKRTKLLGKNEFYWDPISGEIDESALFGIDVIIHLAGEPIAQRWSVAAKERILRSRVESTRLLAEAVAKSHVQPSLICASGINYYGSNLKHIVDESSPSGPGFLAEVCRAWESAAQAAIDAGARVSFMRTGIVLSSNGGALPKMLPPFKIGLGGRIGHGQQLMSWISLNDLVKAYIFAVDNESVCGALNLVAPEPVTNTVFTRTLGSVLSRPTIFPVPYKIVKMIFGEMGEETVLADLGVRPKRLKDLGFQWAQPELEVAFRAVLFDNK